MQRPERFALEADAVGSRGHPDRRADPARLDVGESGAAVGGFDCARGAEAERSGLPRRWGGQPGPAADDRNRDREEAVRLRGRVDDAGEPAARLQRTAHALKGRLLVGEVDEPDAGDDGVEEPLLDVQLLTVHHPGRDVGDASLPRPLLGELQDVAGDVGRQHAPVGPDAPGGRERLPARPGRDIEHARALADRGQVEHQLGRLAQPLL